MSKLLLVEEPVYDPEDRLLTPGEVAAKLSVKTSWVQNHCTRVEPFLPHIMLGRGKHAKRRFRRGDIDRFIEEHFIVPSAQKKRAA